MLATQTLFDFYPWKKIIQFVTVASNLQMGWVQRSTTNIRPRYLQIQMPREKVTEKDEDGTIGKRRLGYDPEISKEKYTTLCRYYIYRIYTSIIQDIDTYIYISSYDMYTHNYVIYICTVLHIYIIYRVLCITIYL